MRQLQSPDKEWARDGKISDCLPLEAITFQDSLNFQGSILQTTSSNLVKAGFDKFVHLKEQLAKTLEDSLNLFVRNGFYSKSTWIDLRGSRRITYSRRKQSSPNHVAHISDGDYPNFHWQQPNGKQTELETGPDPDEVVDTFVTISTSKFCFRNACSWRRFTPSYNSASRAR